MTMVMQERRNETSQALHIARLFNLYWEAVSSPGDFSEPMDVSRSCGLPFCEASH
jgi:hypothetical protein